MGKEFTNIPVDLKDTPLKDTAIVHVLNFGQPLCGFSTSPPVNWPEGNYWVAFEADIKTATCPTCKTQYNTLTDKNFSKRLQT